jgi:carboxyl-terminal processing protease
LKALSALIKDDKLSNMETYRREIVEALNGNIVMRYAYNEGAVEYNAVNDTTVDEAVELLLNNEEYRRILSEQDLDMH